MGGGGIFPDTDRRAVLCCAEKISFLKFLKFYAIIVELVNTKISNEKECLSLCCCCCFFNQFNYSCGNV